MTEPFTQPIKESAWKDPKTWLTICGLALTFCIFLFTFIASRLNSIDSAMTALVVATTKNTTEVEQLKRDVTQLQNDGKTQEQINATIRDRLAKLEAIEETRK